MPSNLGTSRLVKISQLHNVGVLIIQDFNRVHTVEFSTLQISTGLSSTVGVRVSDPVVEILPDYTIRGSDFLEATIPLLYSARINESDVAGVNVSAVRNYLNGLRNLQGISLSNSDRDVAGFQKSGMYVCVYGICIICYAGTMMGDSILGTMR